MGNIFTDLNLSSAQQKIFDEVRKEMEKEYGRLTKMAMIRMLIREKWIEIQKSKTAI